MTLADYAAFLLRLALLGGAVAVTARLWRRRLAPDWSGALAALADMVGGLSLLVVVSELVGSVGRFKTWHLIGAMTLVAAASLALDHRSSPSPPRMRRRYRVTDVIMVVASSALVLAQWSTWVAHSVQAGIGRGGGPANGDSLWYHMPFTAAFVRSGWTSRLLFTNGEALVTYYPANTSLLHAVAYLLMGSDALSVLVNIALIPVALLAGWCIGEDSDAGPAGLAGVAVALTIPVVVVSEAGTAKDDVLGLVGLVAAVAFVVHRQAGNKAGALYGGLAAGLALGSKLTLVAPIGALAVALAILTPKGQRVATMTRWSLAAIATGGYWYLRNLFVVGNPIPGLPLGPLPHPPTPSMDLYGTELLGNLGNSLVWDWALFPGLSTGLGEAWPIVLGVCAMAIVLGFMALRGRRLVPVVTAAFAFAAFLVTPGTVWAPHLINFENVRYITTNLFAFNLRYMLPPVAVALVTVPLVVHRWPRGRLIVSALLAVVLAATQFATTGGRSWREDRQLVALAVGLLTAAAVVAFMRGGRRARVATVVACLVALAGLGLPFERESRRERFTDLALARWAERVAPARIGFSGFVFSYPLYGADYANHVEMIGVHGPEGAWRVAASCEEWRQAVRRAGVDFVVVPIDAPSFELGIDLARWRVGLPGGTPPDEPAEASWTRSDPASALVFVGDSLAAYRINGAATLDGCS
jgi:hypothetical protein